MVILILSGAELRRVIANQLHRQYQIGIAGMSVSISCDGAEKNVAMHFSDGREISDSDTVYVAVNDYIALGGDDILTPIIPAGGYEIDESLPLTRDVFIKWLVDRGGSINALDFETSDNPAWTFPENPDPECRMSE